MLNRLLKPISKLSYQKRFFQKESENVSFFIDRILENKKIEKEILINLKIQRYLDILTYFSFTFLLVNAGFFLYKKEKMMEKH